ncbi:LysR family transcriptional regulator [Vibrio fluvialis]|uniref:LysR family transcriptional regulator n=1 Tax=Vibrio fluvialis TaxID=676 RepID=UPI00192BBBF6|nr:LysR family transcriptional regulator [Vibrio fluvialis]EKO3469497.1 LysR family transcriptional regulator [Vibrio fluvialis]EKO3481955.1 LysR family transcriptional regulator [Vibrio fluvialis]MBL4285942.1 LysR family transcriptional regulator [Vibrio fluvialis]MBL4290337.1 LysR family transcriptional regulator [Vibrio fluvialis]MBY7770398.1 LysR family transcriptional regulator [Vibrio fluvialis]
MDISYRQLKAFIALAEEQNFTYAADKVHITQSALSQMMKKLAQQLSCELYERKGRKIVLTDAGYHLYQEARFIVNRLDKLVQENRDRQHGYNKSLVVSSLYTLCASLAPKTLNDLKKRYPDFTFRLIEERVDDITHSVLEGRADIGINTNPNHPDLNFDLLFRDYLCFVCRADHPLAEQSEISWEQAHQYATIGVSPGNSLRTLADEAFSRVGLTYDPEFSASHTSTLLGMISSGLGSTILSSTIAGLNQSDAIRFIPIVQPVQFRLVGLITRKDTQRALVDEFALILKKHVSESTLWEAGIGVSEPQ